MEIFLSSITSLNIEDEECLNVLSKAEKERILTMSNAKSRKQFIVSRFLLRCMLAKNLKVEPNKVEIIINKTDKPYVKDNPIFFSIAHSNDVIFIVINEHEIGADIEFMKDRKFADLAMHHFSPKNSDKILEADNKKAEFYKQWTLFEAGVKLFGASIFAPNKQEPKYTLSEQVGEYTLAIASNDYDLSTFKIESGESK